MKASSSEKADFNGSSSWVEVCLEVGPLGRWMVTWILTDQYANMEMTINRTVRMNIWWIRNNFIRSSISFKRSWKLEKDGSVLFMLLKGNCGGFFQSNNRKFLKTRNSEFAVSIETSVFREGLKYWFWLEQKGHLGQRAWGRKSFPTY